MAEVSDVHYPPLLRQRDLSNPAAVTQVGEAELYEEEFHFQPDTYADFDSFSAGDDYPRQYFFDDSLDFGSDSSMGSDFEDDEPSCFFYGEEDDEHVNFVTDLFESEEIHLTDDPVWESDSERTRFPVVAVDFDSEEEFEVNSGFINNDNVGEDNDEFVVSSSVRISGNRSETFEWEEVSEGVYLDERDNLSYLIDRIEEVSSSSESDRQNSRLVADWGKEKSLGSRSIDDWGEEERSTEAPFVEDWGEEERESQLVDEWGEEEQRPESQLVDDRGIVENRLGAQLVDELREEERRPGLQFVDDWGEEERCLRSQFVDDWVEEERSLESQYVDDWGEGESRPETQFVDDLGEEDMRTGLQLVDDWGEGESRPETQFVDDLGEEDMRTGLQLVDDWGEEETSPGAELVDNWGEEEGNPEAHLVGGWGEVVTTLEAQLVEHWGEEERGQSRPWEVLLAANNMDWNLDSMYVEEIYDDGSEVPNINLHQDYIWATEYVNLLSQLVENINPSRGSSPAAKSVVENLPSVVMTKAMVEESNNELVCVVCRDGLVVGEKATKMPCCHLFHGDCILPWLNIRNTCPVCRHQLPTDDEDHGSGVHQEFLL